MRPPALPGALTRRHCLGVAAAALLGGPAKAAAPAQGWERWRMGAWRGFTTDNLPRLSFQTLDALAATGARLARVGVRLRNCGVCGDELAALQALLDHAHARRVGLVLLSDGEDFLVDGALWKDAATQRQFVQTWARFAGAVGRHPAVVGLDLLNEPHPPMPDGDVQPPQRLWGGLALRCIEALRQAGATAPVVFEPVAGGSALGFKGMAALPVAGVVYSVHFYTPHDITHQQVSPTWPRRLPYPAGPEHGLGAWDAELGVGRIDKARLTAELRFVRAFQLRHAAPMYVGEFGCARWAPEGSAQRWVEDCLSLFQQYGWSWSFHSFRTWPGWDAEIDSEDPAARARDADAPLMRSLRRAIAAPLATPLAGSA